MVRVYGERDGVGFDSLYPYITINPDTSALGYHRGSGDILSIPLVPSSELLDSTIRTNLEAKDLTFEISDKKLEIKLLLQNFAVKNPAYTGTGGYEYYTISGVGLVKEKK